MNSNKMSICKRLKNRPSHYLESWIENRSGIKTENQESWCKQWKTNQSSISMSKIKLLCKNLTCSAFKVSWMKICCSFSFTKLMQNCSNPFLSKISNPYMSRIPILFPATFVCIASLTCWKIKTFILIIVLSNVGLMD